MALSDRQDVYPTFAQIAQRVFRDVEQLVDEGWLAETLRRGEKLLVSAASREINFERCSSLEAVSKPEFDVVDEATSPCLAENAAGLVASSATKILEQ